MPGRKQLRGGGAACERESAGSVQTWQRMETVYAALPWRPLRWHRPVGGYRGRLLCYQGVAV